MQTCSTAARGCHGRRPFQPQRASYSSQRPSRSSRLMVQARQGGMEPFNEGAAQVKRLINRDRKELLGNKDDILDKYETEFGNSKLQQTQQAQQAQQESAKSPFASSDAVASPFGSASSSSSTSNSSSNGSISGLGGPSFKGLGTSASPFGTTPSQRRSIEPVGLQPDMGPDPVQKETPLSLLQSINMTQVVLFFSFSLIIALMLATFQVVVSAGGVRLAGIE